MQANTMQPRDRQGTVKVMPQTRLAGISIDAGAIAYGVHILLRSMLTAGVDPAEAARSALWVPVNALGALGAALVLLSLPAIAARIAGRLGSRALVGIGLIAASWTFFGLFLSLYGALVLPWLADEAPHLVDGSAPTPVAVTVAFSLGLVAWLAGAVLIAVPFIKCEARPQWIGYLLPASALWFLAGSFVIAPDGPASNLGVNLLSNLGPMLLLVALGSLARRAWADAGAHR